MKRLKPVIKHYLWGGHKMETLFSREGSEAPMSESWELSVHPDGVSGTDEGELRAYLAAHPHAVFPEGGELPVLIKFIDAAQDLSVQVHPDEAFAQRTEHDHGKTEMWYIVSAEEGAGIYCGFSRDTSEEEFLAALKEGRAEELLHFIPVHAGDCYLIEAGTVHAIGAGCVICEVQQSSNVTYRIYDYDRRDADGNPRPLHLDKARAVMNYSAHCDRTYSGSMEEHEGYSLRLLTDCMHFRCRELRLRGSFCGQNDASFAAVNILEGEGKIGGETFSAGDSFFIPCGEGFEMEGNALAILTDAPSRTVCAGVDLGGTAVKCGIVDHAGRILAKTGFPTRRERPYGEIAADIAGAVRALCEKLGLKEEALARVGIGSPGTVDSANGVIVYSNNIAWKNVPLGKSVADILHKPVFVTNDANAAAFGEFVFGAGKKYRSMVLVTLGTGIGGGIVIDGKLFEGNRSAGTEIGHTVIRMRGERCTCGRRGCFEAYASATALIRRTRLAMKRDPHSALWQIASRPEDVDGKTAFAAMRAGDPAAKSVVSWYIAHLAAGLVNIANVFRPETIVLGGGVCAEPSLLPSLERYFKRDLYGGSGYAPVELKTASLGNDAGLCGAAEYARTR